MARTLLISSALLMLAACGGGSDSGGAVTGLSGPQQVTIVDANNTNTSPVRLPAGVRGVEGSDYNTDPTRMWVRDDSMETLDTINMILDFLGQTHYADQTNAGPYRALVAQQDRDGGERGQSGTEYMEFVVNSTRAKPGSRRKVSASRTNRCSTSCLFSASLPLSASLSAALARSCSVT